MSTASEMQTHLWLPSGVLFHGAAIRVSGEALDGCFGILPNHVDWVTALVPSVLLVKLPNGRTRYFGVDEGLLVKKGHRVDVAVRRGIESSDLESLSEAVGGSFAGLADEEKVARAALSRLEADIVRRFAHLRKRPQ